jgi:DNA repair protein RadC
MKKENPHYFGHRKRLKNKLIMGYEKAISDYELIEIILFFIIPRKDVKPLAKDLLKHFNNLNNLINVTKKILLEVPETNESLYVILSLIRELSTRILKQKITNIDVISSWSSLVDYLKFSMGNLKIEQFRVLFLNSKNSIIVDEIISEGTIDEIAIYPREIVKRALLYDASAIILIHNHPSGVSNPSINDINMTIKLICACENFNISVHDHVIVTKDECFSFKEKMLI